MRVFYNIVLLIRNCLAFAQQSSHHGLEPGSMDSVTSSIGKWILGTFLSSRIPQPRLGSRVLCSTTPTDRSPFGMCVAKLSLESTHSVVHRRKIESEGAFAVPEYAL